MAKAGSSRSQSATWLPAEQRRAHSHPRSNDQVSPAAGRSPIGAEEWGVCVGGGGVGAVKPETRGTGRERISGRGRTLQRGSTGCEGSPCVGGDRRARRCR